MLRAAGADGPSPNPDPGTLRYLSGTHSNILSQGTIQYNTLSRTKVPSFQVSVGTALQASRTSNFEDHLKYSPKTKSTFCRGKKKSQTKFDSKVRFVTLFPKVRTATLIFSSILVTAENKRNATAEDQAELTHSVPASFFQQDHWHFKLVSRVVTLQQKAKLEHRQGKVPCLLALGNSPCDAITQLQSHRPAFPTQEMHSIGSGHPSTRLKPQHDRS